MPDASESKPLLDLSELKLVPKWVSDFSTTPSRTDADFSDRDTREHRGPRDRDQRGGGGGGYRGDQRGVPPRGDRRSGPGGPPGGRPQSGGRGDDRRSGGGYRDRGPHGRDDRGPRPVYNEGPKPVPGIKVSVEPESKATEAMASMIRTAGKAYSVFDAARLVLASGDRFHVKFALPADSQQKFYAVPAESSLWLNREDALSHVLQGEALNEYYRAEDVELEVPKGNFTSVAVCGMSGELLGPPSHHSYQTNLHKVHRERFSHMAFEDYKRRVRVDSTPEAVEKWKESQKHSRHWVALKEEVAEGAEPMTLKSRGEMETHFRKHYGDALVREVTEATVTGNIPKNLLAPALYLHLRAAVDEARKHLLQTAQQLCGGFEQQGLKLFKRRGGKLWVSRTRPRIVDAGTVLSVRIAKIMEVVKAQPGISTKELVEVISPSTPGEVVAPSVPVEAKAAVEDPEVTEVALVETRDPAAAVAEEIVSAPETSEAAAHALTDDQLLVLKDLHWLNSEGYVIEYADGIVYPGVTEPPPPKPKVVKEPTAPVAEKPVTTGDEAPMTTDTASELAHGHEVAVAEEPPASATVAEEAPAVAELPIVEEAVPAATEEASVEPEEAPLENRVPAPVEAPVVPAAEELPIVEEAPAAAIQAEEGGAEEVLSK